MRENAKMPPRPRWWHQLQSSKHEALLAIDLYNRSGESRQLEAFIVHMSMAWLRLLQAHVAKDGGDVFVRDRRGHRIRHQDGDWKMKPLSELVESEFDLNDPMRANLEFFTKLRNIIEHRYERDTANLVAGRTQAYVLNYERKLVDWFGTEEGMANQLRFPMFVSSITDDAVAALKEVRKRVPSRVLEWLEDYDATLDAAVTSDQTFNFQVYLVPDKGPKTQADAAMTFVKMDELTDEQRKVMDQAMTIIREKKVPVVNLENLRPKDVVGKVSDGLGKPFSINDHTNAWKHYKVRPATRSSKPEDTKQDFCLYDRTWQAYVYTTAWVEYLIRKLSDEREYEAVCGRKSPHSSHAQQEDEAADEASSTAA